MKIPYGIADFANIRRAGSFYVDKTPFLEKLERFDLTNVVFLRPRRMGKSSLVSMMAHYYDIARADQFDELFGGLWVHEHPTPEKNAHIVFHLNLGSVRGTTEEAIKHGFVLALRETINDLLPRYLDRSRKFTKLYDRVDDISDPIELLFETVSAAKSIQQRLYIMIDEYDTFANNLIAANNKNVYDSLTEETGFIREFYAALKSRSETGGIARIFITGVSPLLLDDLYTGFNISRNITTDPSFHALVGFTRADVEHAVDELLRTQPELADDGRIGNRGTFLDTLERFYNGYRFSFEVKDRIFNSDMVLYFLSQLQSKRKYPSQMLDPNARTDYKKFYGLFESSGQPMEERREVLTTVLTEGGVSGRLIETFGLTPRPAARDQFISLLFYTGLLTAGTEPQTEQRMRFEIPNQVIRELQWEHFSAMLEQVDSLDMRLPAIVSGQRQMAGDGTIKPFLEAIHEHVMRILGLKDMRNFSEKNMKMILVTSAILSSIFYALSEKEVAQGFCDLFLVPRADNFTAKYSWLIELKYLSAKATEAKIEEAFQKAEAQLAKYASDPVLVPILTKNHAMKSVAVVFVGTKEIRCRPWPKGSGEAFVVPKRKVAAKSGATKKAATKKRGR